MFIHNLYKGDYGVKYFVCKDFGLIPLINKKTESKFYRIIINIMPSSLRLITKISAKRKANGLVLTDSGSVFSLKNLRDFNEVVI